MMVNREVARGFAKVLRAYSGVLARRLGFRGTLDLALPRLGSKENQRCALLRTMGRARRQPLWPRDWSPTAGDGDRWSSPSVIWCHFGADLHSDHGLKGHSCHNFFRLGHRRISDSGHCYYKSSIWAFFLRCLRTSEL